MTILKLASTLEKMARIRTVVITDCQVEEVCAVGTASPTGRFLADCHR